MIWDQIREKKRGQEKRLSFLSRQISTWIRERREEARHCVAHNTIHTHIYTSIPTLSHTLYLPPFFPQSPVTPHILSQSINQPLSHTITFSLTIPALFSCIRVLTAKPFFVVHSKTDPSVLIEINVSKRSNLSALFITHFNCLEKKY